MNIIGIQLDIVWENKQANFDKIHALLANTTVEPGSLIVLPEMFATGFSMNVAGICEDEKQETQTFLRTLSQQYQATILGGLVTKDPAGLGRNEALVFDPSGKEIARYCKMHPFSPGGENQHYQAGNEIVTFAWNGFTVSPLICYDLRFPEVFRHAQQCGADCFAVIASWPQARTSHWTALLSARAIENQADVVGVNRCGADPSFTYGGRSLIINHHGTLLADAGEGECIFTAPVDHQALKQYRQELPFLNDIRPESIIRSSGII